MPNGWRTIKSLVVHKIRLHGRRGKGMAESFSREKLRHAPQKEGGWEILCDLPPVWPRLVHPTNLMSRMNGKKTHKHTHTHNRAIRPCHPSHSMPLALILPRGDQWYLLRGCMCVFFPFILHIKFVGRTSRGHTGGRSHRIFHPPSFCGACLIFSREKDSAIPFPRRPWSRILCINDLIVLHSLGIYFFIFLFCSEKNPVYRDRTHVPTCQKVTRLPLSNILYT